MPDFTWWEIILMGLLLTGVQAGTDYICGRISKWFQKRKNNTICDLYVNDELVGKHTFQECRQIYETITYSCMKSSGFTKKTKRFHITTDLQ